MNKFYYKDVSKSTGGILVSDNYLLFIANANVTSRSVFFNFKKLKVLGTSLVVQCMDFMLPMQEARV